MGCGLEFFLGLGGIIEFLGYFSFVCLRFSCIWIIIVEDIEKVLLIFVDFVSSSRLLFVLF